MIMEVSGFDWQHEERMHHDKRWIPAIRIWQYEPRAVERYIPGWILCDTKDKAREVNRRLAAEFADKHGVPIGKELG